MMCAAERSGAAIPKRSKDFVVRHVPRRPQFYATEVPKSAPDG